MSRRKQGRPQQRKATDSLEQENDLLVCGDCQANFPLKDILRFIRHKVRRCNKENCDVLDSGGGGEFEDEDGDSDSAPTVACIGSKRPSISAPITRKESVESRHSPRPSIDVQKELGGFLETKKRKHKDEDDEDEDMEGKEEEKGQRAPLKAKQVVDKESNTTLSEPSKFVCENCKNTFNSAWTLLQHAQKEHGMKIYTTPPPPLDISTPSPRPSTEHRTPPSVSSGHESPFSHPSPFTPFRPPFDNVHPPPQHGSPLSIGSPLSPFNRPPHGLDFPLEMMHEQLFSRIRPPGLPGFAPGMEHHPRPPPPFSHPAFDRSRLTLDSQIDFYSKRLQQLAQTSPVMQKPGPPFNQAAAVLSSLQQQQQQQQQHQQQQQNQQHSPQMHRQSPQTPQQQQQQQSQSLSQSQDGISRHQSSSNANKTLSNKACEFCGKTFRFQSNLIVHRRSHTGEKPFRCPLCPHACTQQSKLKRHMKTHMNKSSGAGLGSNTSTSEGSVPSSSSTPDSNRNAFLNMDGARFDLDEDEDDDEEEDEDEDEEEMMDEDLEEDEMEAMNEEAEEDRRAREANRIKTERLESESKQPERLGDKDNNDIDNRSIDNHSVDHPSNSSERDQGSTDGNFMNHNGAPSGADSPELKDKKPPSSSLLTEVMENSGLKNFPEYNEAYRQALEENNCRPESSKDSDTEKEGEENGRSSSEDLKRDYSPPQMSPSSGRFPLPHPLHSPFSYGSPGSGPSPISDLHMKHGIKREPPSEPLSNLETAMYSRYWFPPTNPLREMYPGFSPFGLPPHRDFRRDENGFNPAAADSALHMPKPGPSTPTSPTNGNSLIRKDRGRNDTCEFCGKVFKNCSNLTVHRRSHTGEKPYKCELCSYACAQSSKLTRHMKTHGRLGKDVFRCKFCSMPFSVPSTLEKHMRKCVETRQAQRLRMAEGDRSGLLSNGGDSRGSGGMMANISNLDGRGSGMMSDSLMSNGERSGYDLDGRRNSYPEMENHRPMSMLGDIDTSDTSSTTASNL